MTVKEYTAYQQLEIPVYDVPGWHQYIDRNFHAIDGAIYMLTGTTNIRGVWRNSTVYNINNQVVDHLTNTIHKCLVQHTSPDTGTFQAYRTANPTHWSAALTLFQGTSTPDRFEFLNTDDAVTLVDASVEFRGGVAIGKRLLVGSYVSVSSSDNMGLAVGRQGRTDPVFSVWTGTLNQVTGIRVIGQPGGSGADIDITSPGGNEDLRINAKGTGRVIVGGTSTGQTVINNIATFLSPVNIQSTNTAAFVVGNVTAGSQAFRVKTDQVTGVNIGTGLMITSTDPGGGLTVTTIGGGTNEDLRISAKGTGALVLNPVGTGQVQSSRQVSLLASTAATNDTTGALIVSGGIGVAGHASAPGSWFGGPVNMDSTLFATGVIRTDATFNVGLDIVVRTPALLWAVPNASQLRDAFDPAIASLQVVGQHVCAIINDLRYHGLFKA